MSGSLLITLGSVLSVIGLSTVIGGNIALWFWLNNENNTGGRKQ